MNNGINRKGCVLSPYNFKNFSKESIIAVIKTGYVQIDYCNIHGFEEYYLRTKVEPLNSTDLRSMSYLNDGNEDAIHNAVYPLSEDADVVCACFVNGVCPFKGKCVYNSDELLSSKIWKRYNHLLEEIAVQLNGEIFYPDLTENGLKELKKYLYL